MLLANHLVDVTVDCRPNDLFSTLGRGLRKLLRIEHRVDLGLVLGSLRLLLRNLLLVWKPPNAIVRLGRHIADWLLLMTVERCSMMLGLHPSVAISLMASI